MKKLKKIHAHSLHQHIKRRTHFSQINLIVFSLIFAGIGGYILLQGHAAGTTANLFVDTNGGTCTRQAAAGNYIDSQACASFSSAWSAAQCGDVIAVEAGSYGSQSISASKSCTPSAQINFSAQGTVNLTGGMDINTSYAAFSGNFNFNQTYSVEQGASYVSLTDVSAPHAFIMGSNITIKGGQIGPNNNCATGWEDGLQIWDNGSVSASFVTVDGVTFHDISDNGNECAGYPNSGVHTDCVQMLGPNNVTIKNSKFYNCATSDIIGRPYTTTLHDITIQNNMMGPVVTPGASINIGSSGDVCNNVVVQYNTISGTYPSMVCGAAGSTGNIVRGNIFPGYYSQAGFSNSYNISIATAAIGTGSKKCTPVFNPASSATADYHLDSSDTCAKGGGDPANYPATDFDGDSRSSPPDAGADELAVPSGPTANLWVDPTGGTCTRQATATAYNDAQACASLQAAVAASQPGDQIIIKVGSYGNQNITSSSSSPGVTITGEQSGGSNAVTLSGLKPTGNWLTITNVNVTSGLDIEDTPVGTPNNITFNNIDWTGNWWLSNCCSNITQNGGRIHNYSAASDPTAIMFQTSTASTPMSNIMLDGVEIDHMTHTVTGSHFEAVRTQGWVSNLTIKNSYFHDNGVNSSQIFISSFTGGTSHTPGPIIIEGNYFDVPVSGAGDGPAFYDINGNMQGLDCPDMTVRYNTDKGSMISPIGDSNGISCAAGSYTNVKISSNIGPRLPGSCNYYTYDHNLWINGSSANCGATDQTVASTAAAGLTGDGFHITGSSPAINAGDPSYCPSKDRDGDSRPQGVACDAGADEYVSGAINPPPAKPGDINGDGKVSLADLAILLTHYGQTANASQGDLNSDGRVTLADLAILLTNYGR